jgi:lipoprotein-releasing system ATP-binding protein
MNILEAQHIDKTFTKPRPFQVLKDISLSVGKGELISLVGKSGCGKSTLLYILSTLDSQYSGKLTIMGELMTGCTQDQLARFRNRNIGFVFQFHYLLPEFTVLKNILLPAMKVPGRDPEEAENKAMQILKLMDMEDLYGQPSGKLSGGQQQRVAIARALINDPAIIMADEPTGNLDSYNARIVQDLLTRIASEGNTVITVTHDKDFAKAANRVIEMADGRILDPV